jgi:NAD-reducing hydrogenase small subunit
MGKPTIATVWLEGCSGCHMSFLDLDEALVDILAAVDLTVTPITDFKNYDFPRVDVGIIEGGIGNTEQEEIAHKVRKSCTILVAWGDCAVFGGVNTLRNGLSTEEVLQYGYVDGIGSLGGEIPNDPELPRLLDRVLPVNQVAKVDAYLPGCPPEPAAIAYSLKEILAGRIPILSSEMMHFD